MTRTPPDLDEALEQHDVTVALTPGQAILAIVGAMLLLRLLRRLLARA